MLERADAPIDETVGLDDDDGSGLGEVVFLTIRAFREQGYDLNTLILLSAAFGPDINSVTDAKEQKEEAFSALLQEPELPFYLHYLDITTGLKWEVSDEVKHALDRINSTNSTVGNKLTERLNQWHTLLSSFPSEDSLSPLRIFDSFFRLSTEERSEPELEVIAFLREYANDLNTVAIIVSDGLVRGSKKTLSLLSMISPKGAKAGGNAYLEALNIIRLPIMFEPKNELRPPDFARAILFYMIARRLGDKDVIAEALADMIHGVARRGNGPLYKMAWLRYEKLPDVERELVADAYCEGFVEGVERIPYEAFLCPALAVRWAMRRGDWKAKKALPDDLPLQLLPNDGSDISREENAGLAEDSFAQYEQLPDYDLALRHYGNDIPLSQLASELGISKTAVYKRIRNFLDKAKNLPL